MSWLWLSPRAEKWTNESFSRWGRNRRLETAAKRQPAPDPAAWLATHEPTRCPDGYAWHDTIADPDTDDAAEIARRHNLP